MISVFEDSKNSDFPTTSCVTLGKLLTLSGFQHLYYKRETIGGFMAKFVHEAPTTMPGT